MAKIDASAVILAGGRSRRMGQPKAALPLGGTTLLRRMTVALTAKFTELIVVAAPFADEPYRIEELLTDLLPHVVLVRDDQPFAGPVPALIRGLRASSQDAVFVGSCDLPLLRAATAIAIVGMLEDFDAAVPIVDGRMQPLCAAYSRASIATLERASRGESRLTAIVKGLNTRWFNEAELCRLEPDLHSFINVNTPEDYRRVLKLAGHLTRNRDE